MLKHNNAIDSVVLKKIIRYIVILISTGLLFNAKLETYNYTLTLGVLIKDYHVTRVVKESYVVTLKYFSKNIYSNVSIYGCSKKYCHLNVYPILLYISFSCFHI